MGAENHDMGAFIETAVQKVGERMAKEFEIRGSVMTRFVMYFDPLDKEITSRKEWFVEAEFGGNRYGILDNQDMDIAMQSAEIVMRSRNLSPFATVIIMEGKYRAYTAPFLETLDETTEKFNDFQQHGDKSNLKGAMVVYGVTYNHKSAMALYQVHDKKAAIMEFYDSSTDFDNVMGFEPVKECCERLMESALSLSVKSIEHTEPDAMSVNLLDVPLDPLPPYRMN